MPVVSLNEINKESSWILWKIEEDFDFYIKALDQNREEEEFYNSITNPEKKLEFLASRTALKKLVKSTGVLYYGVTKDSLGKPHLNDHSFPISISHCFPYTVALIHKTRDVGIDIERLKDKILRIGPRFLNDHELKSAKNDISRTTIYWAAKESLYKLHGRKFLVFKDNLLVHPFDLDHKGEIEGEIILPGEHSYHRLNYETHEDYIITYNT